MSLDKNINYAKRYKLNEQYIAIEQSMYLSGTVDLIGAKNSVLVIMASLILTSGKSILRRVPVSSDVFQMIKLLESLGVIVEFDKINNVLRVDTSDIKATSIPFEVMIKMRASVLAMGPLLAKFGKANVSLPGGCSIGVRPIDYHLRSFEKMGAKVEYFDDSITAYILNKPRLNGTKIILEYPSVGATENILMAACLSEGETRIVNAAIEPEVLDLIKVLQKMGAEIQINACNNIVVKGVKDLSPIEHNITLDRLEAGSFLLAGAITKGYINIPQAPAFELEVFLLKLEQMGHIINTGPNELGVELTACESPKSIDFKTMPYPGFPTDLQAQTMSALCIASGISTIYETVFENRLLHIGELQKMGAQISVIGNNIANVKGVDKLYGARVNATDIRAACGLILAGLVAHGNTEVIGTHHLKRGYQDFIQKLQALGAKIKLVN